MRASIGVYFSLAVCASSSIASVTTCTVPSLPHHASERANQLSVTASLAQRRWRNTTNISLSVFDPDGTDAHPATSLYPCCVQETSNSALAFRTLASWGMSTITETYVVTITSVLPTPTHTSPRFDHISWQTDVNSTAQNMSALIIAFEAIMATFEVDEVTTELRDGDLDVDASNGHEPPAGMFERTSSANRAAMNLPGGKIIFLNTTSPNYVMFDNAGANVLVWTVPNATETQDSQFHKLVENISTWLPLVEALGLLAVIWEIGKFAYGRVQMFRGARRAQQERV